MDKKPKKIWWWFKEFTLNKKGDYSSHEWVWNWITIFIIISYVLPLLIFVWGKNFLSIVTFCCLWMVFSSVYLYFFTQKRAWLSPASFKRLEKWSRERTSKYQKEILENHDWLEITKLSQNKLFIMAKKLELTCVFTSKKIAKGKLLKMIYEFLYEV